MTSMEFRHFSTFLDVFVVKFFSMSIRSIEISGREAEAIEIVRRGVPVRGDLANSKETIILYII
jgi:hypothetical protein